VQYEQQEEKSLQGWGSSQANGLTVAQVVDLAFDYRGDVTVAKTDGSQVVGYLSNRDGTATEPFIQLLRTPERGTASATEPLTIPYRDILHISFSGKDTAAGQSYEAWKQRKQKAQQKET
jgi:hypothetical protein